MVPVYGRRRGGKTELLLRFIAGKPAVYFSATQKLRGPQIADLMRAAAAALSRPELAGAGPATWEAALRLVVAAAPEGRKLVLVIDEFQWLCESSPDLPSVLQRLWDLEWQRPSRPEQTRAPQRRSRAPSRGRRRQALTHATTIASGHCGPSARDQRALGGGDRVQVDAEEHRAGRRR